MIVNRASHAYATAYERTHATELAAGSDAWSAHVAAKAAGRDAAARALCRDGGDGLATVIEQERKADAEAIAEIEATAWAARDESRTRLAEERCAAINTKRSKP